MQRDRLGNLKNGAKDITGHAWFRGLSWEALHARAIKAPVPVTVKSDEDASNFDDYDDADGPDVNAAYVYVLQPLLDPHKHTLHTVCRRPRRQRRVRDAALSPSLFRSPPLPLALSRSRTLWPPSLALSLSRSLAHYVPSFLALA